MEFGGLPTGNVKNWEFRVSNGNVKNYTWETCFPLNKNLINWTVALDGGEQGVGGQLEEVSGDPKTQEADPYGFGGQLESQSD